MENITEEENVFNAERWGISLSSIENLGKKLREKWKNYRDLMRTKTRDTSEYGWLYLRGLLTMEKKRNYTNISKNIEGVRKDGQNIQHFMSDSPWNGKEIFFRIQQELAQQKCFKGGMLTLDDSGDPRSGGKSAGTIRQYLGRLGKVEMGQVGVVLGYYHKSNWTLLDSELYLPECWFDEEYSSLRKKCLIPNEKEFKSKTEIGLEMILQAKERGIPFSAFSCDCFYGHDTLFRRKLAENNITYMASVKCNYKVYLTKPEVYWRKPKRKRKRDRIMEIKSLLNPVPVKSLLSTIQLENIFVRDCERGMLFYQCARLPVFTVDDNGIVSSETLLIRQEGDKFTFALSNACPATSLNTLISWRCQRFFIERTIQDCKEELGWDEIQAIKYRAWMHHLALIALALWFACEIKSLFSSSFAQDSTLKTQLQVRSLPQISLPNIRSILQVLFPVFTMSIFDVQFSIIRTFVARARSTGSRLRKHFYNQELLI